jgi:16S rRNA (cytosine967-C5)-methyltransferase
VTPGARVAAAIGVLEDWLAGMPAERALLRWSRGARYAGSKDRAAVRDHVFDALRRLRSSAALGGGLHGRGVLLGLMGPGPFDGQGHAPEPPAPAERALLAEPPPLTRAEALDVPDWLLPELEADLGDRAEAILEAMRHRAPVGLRVNLARIDREAARRLLAEEGIGAEPSGLSPSALVVPGGARAVSRSRAYAEGLVELQDPASQAAADAVPAAGRVLDLCAGGGGKALALAARGAEVWAHDASPARMRDLAPRAERARTPVAMVERPEEHGPFDAVLVDAPCSGSGSWRRDPEGKWRLTPERLDALTGTQDAILDRAAGLVAPGGTLVHATCSLLSRETGGRVDAFHRRHRDWTTVSCRTITPLDGGDGFGIAVLRRGAGVGPG